MRELLEDQQDFRVIDAASSAEEAMSVAEREELDVAVVDYQLGGFSSAGLESRLWGMLRKVETLDGATDR